MEFLNEYFEYIKTHPAGSIIFLLFFTLIIWAIIWKHRERFLTGLAGDGGHPGNDNQPNNLDAREQLIFIYYFIPIPAIFYVLFFPGVTTFQFAAMCITVAPGFYQIFGRFIFDWILALRSGQPIKQSEPEVKTTTTTTTETK